MYLIIVSIIGAAVIGGGAVASYTNLVTKRRSSAASDQASKILDEARANAKELTLEAKTEALRVAEAAKREEKERRTDRKSVV